MRVSRLLFMSSVIVHCVARAQGLSGSEVSGIVRFANGRPSENAVVALTDRNTGARRMMRSLAGGMYRFENVEIGTYKLEARALGVKESAPDSIEMHLGDRLKVDIILGAQMSVIETEVIVAQRLNPRRLRDPGAGGSAQTIAGRAAQNIPLMNRDFVNLLTLSSQALGPQGLWISGQHPRYNAIQIDGAATNDFYGISVTPGSAAGSRLISPEAIEEVRILVAPFDVRMGGFSGGLINAVTRSGSNRQSSSAFASLARSELMGTDTSGAQPRHFNQIQYGVTASGPIIRDRLHYFLAADFQQRSSILTGLRSSDSSTGVTEATVLRIRNALRNRFGFDPGGTEAPDVEAPTSNVFLKMAWHPRANVSIELTPSYASSTRDTLTRSIGTVDGWRLSQSGAELFSTTRGATLKANFSVGPISNETTGSYRRTVFGFQSNITAPVFLVQADATNVYAAAGSVSGAQGSRTFESVAQLAHNASWTIGDHTLVLGTQDLLVRVRHNFLNSGWGLWTFASVDSLEEGRPSKYEVALPSRPGQPTASYHSLLASIYLQDEWEVTPAIRITTGLRGDASYLPHPHRNALLLADDTLGNIDTHDIASGNWSLSPRIGFAWTLDRRGRQMLRGGIGLFAARPPYAWTTSAYSQTGETQSFLTCTTDQGVPPVTADIDHLPASCTGNGGNSTVMPPVIYFARNFHLPQSLKAVIGFDAELGDGWNASVDVAAARTRNQAYISDRNLVFKSTSGEQRAMYGTISPTGSARPARVSSAYGGVYRLGNYSADRSFSATASVRRQWSSDRLIDVGYTWSRTLDVMGMSGFIDQAIFRANPVDGTLESRALRRSARDIPHNLVAIAIFPAGAGFTAGLFLRARSGTPWAFTVGGDANADGAQGNDLAYIPRDSTDVSLLNPAAFGALNNLIEQLGCTRSQRGHIMQRNSCRNPTVKRLDGRIAKSFGQSGNHRIEVSADVFNVPNLLNHRWGIMRETSNREDVPLMAVLGWDDAYNRPRYAVPTPPNGIPLLPSINKAVIDASRWSIQLGARYEF